MLGSQENKKTKNLILYICEKLGNEKTFGATVLNKTLYYIDNIWYLETMKAISIFSYIRQSKGATPKPSQFINIRQQLIDEKSLVIEDRKYFGRNQKVPKALVKADLSYFTSQELSHIDEIIKLFEDTSATIASKMSHEELSWRIGKHMEELPFHSFLLTEADLTEKDVEWGLKAIKRYESETSKKH